MPGLSPRDRRYRRGGHVTWTQDDGLIMIWGGVAEHVYRKPKGPNKSPDCGNSFHDPGCVTVFDPELEVWGDQRTGGRVPPPTVAPAAACQQGETLFVFGGLVMLETPGGYYELQTSSSLHTLSLTTWQWTEVRLEREQRPPPPSEKGVAWHHADSFYVFGGFCWDGDQLERRRSQGGRQGGGQGEFEVSRDVETGGGWHNALVRYRPSQQAPSVHWPVFTGALPSPRAGAAVCSVGREVFIFGGRCRQRRLNDLYRLDLLSLTCTTVHTDTNPDMFGPPSSLEPAPRSLHSLTYDGEGRLVVYGGLGQLSAPLNDCWVLEVETERWREQELGYDHGQVRCWHSALLSHQQVIIHSGLTQEFYLTRADLDDHCEDFLRLQFGKTTTSLRKLALESVINYLTSTTDEDQVIEIIESLPPMLKKSVLTRISETSDQSSETGTDTEYSRSRLHSGV